MRAQDVWLKVRSGNPSRMLQVSEQEYAVVKMWSERKIIMVEEEKKNLVCLTDDNKMTIHRCHYHIRVCAWFSTDFQEYCKKKKKKVESFLESFPRRTQREKSSFLLNVTYMFLPHWTQETGVGNLKEAHNKYLRQLDCETDIEMLDNAIKQSTVLAALESNM